MNILKIAGTVLELIPVIGQIFAIFGKKKAQKKAAEIETALSSVILGVQYFRDAQSKNIADNLKNKIESISVAKKTEGILKPLVKKYTGK